MKKILYAALLLLPALAEGQAYLEQFPFRQTTKYFDFRYKGNPEKIAAIARFADGFIDLLNKDCFNANFDYPILVLVLEDRASFQQFLRREFHANHPPQFGIYLGAQKLFATYEESGLGVYGGDPATLTAVQHNTESAGSNPDRSCHCLSYPWLR